MSQSPLEARYVWEGEPYAKGLAQLDQMMRAGHSFSGREKNCAFLNAGDGTFANVSAIAGFDFEDDGRAVAAVDWDRDGDLDLWCVNRTAPGLRLLRNDASDSHHYLRLRLEGVSCNRDAIGARVELQVESPASDRDAPRLVRSLRAGEGFLAQSSKWLHFGLGGNAERVAIKVIWPDGSIDEHLGLPTNQQLLVKQHSQKPVVWEPPPRGEPLAAAKLTVASPTQARAVLLTERIAMPRIEYADFDGSRRLLGDVDGQPVLLNLWASWCRPCLAELKELAAEHPALEKAGVRIVALSVDGLGDQSGNVESARALAKKLALPFETGLASESLAAKLQLLSDHIFYSKTPLPVPTSVLIDDRGQLVAAYRGPVNVERLLADVGAVRMDLGELGQTALPFAGRWFRPPDSPAFSLLAGAFAKAGFPRDAVAYLERYGDQMTEEPNYGKFLNNLGASFGQRGDLESAVHYLRRATKARPRFAPAHFNLAHALAELGQTEKAIESLENSVREDPYHQKSQQMLVELLVREGRSDEAIARLQDVLERGIALPGGRVRLAKLYESTGSWTQARDQYRAALTESPQSIPALVNFARFLATGPDASHRDVSQAIALAEQAVEHTNREDAIALATLAATYGAADRTDEAASIARAAIRLAQRGGNRRLVKQLERQLESWDEPSP
ncbi:ASPIC/UnbV domain-containing protein [Pirellulales bacterium]|nr:ASPIC/UnbV domain-containing protein [Pirellulales bacterium]